jgi:formylglycine-generating enzyme required for sulfatase activity
MPVAKISAPQKAEAKCGRPQAGLRQQLKAAGGKVTKPEVRRRLLGSALIAAGLALLLNTPLTPLAPYALAKPGRGVLTAPQERKLRPKDTFEECADCPQMLVVPAGSFIMGSPVDEPGRSFDEGPQHTVTIGAPFAVGRYEVTFDQWNACVADGGCNGYKPSDQGWGRGKRPVINVNWDDAKTYVAWLAKKTSKPYRLLTESEYEYAARAGTTTVEPWGSAIGTGNANCSGCGSQWDGKETAPVGSFHANGFGLYDMVGNVWEWTEDCYVRTYADAPADGSPKTGGNCDSRVARGGSWAFNPQVVRSASRARIAPDHRGNDIGFRVGRTLAAP